MSNFRVYLEIRQGGVFLRNFFLSSDVKRYLQDGPHVMKSITPERVEGRILQNSHGNTQKCTRYNNEDVHETAKFH